MARCLFMTLKRHCAATFDSHHGHEMYAFECHLEMYLYYGGNINIALGNGLKESNMFHVIVLKKDLSYSFNMYVHIYREQP